MNKKLDLVYTPGEHQGFLGAGHIARYVLEGDFKQTDPFIFLADDVLYKKDDNPVGGPHPHAGFETVTLVLEGELSAENHPMKTGDFQLMTAGSGVVHAEIIDKKMKMRILQLWLTLPQKLRWVNPRVQDLHVNDVPAHSENGWNVRVYSGSFAGLTSPVLNYVPLTLADIKLQPGAQLNTSIPNHYNAFLYVIDGAVKVGDENQWLQPNQVGWLNKSTDQEPASLQLTAGPGGARVVFYAGEPQGDTIVSHGPFIGNTDDDIKRLYKEYRAGKMQDVSVLPKEDVFVW